MNLSSSHGVVCAIYAVLCTDFLSFPVESVQEHNAYFDLLDDQCSSFKKGAKGGVAWFAHVWEDQGLPGWGIVRGGKPKFNFSARSRC